MNSNKNKDYFGGYTKKLLSTQSILDVFVLQGLLDLEDAQKLKNRLKTSREVENFLVRNKLVSRETINKAYSILLKMPYISLKNLEISEVAKSTIPLNLAKKFKLMPFDLRGKVLKLAVIRPSDLLVYYSSGLGKLLQKNGLTIEIYITSDSDFMEALAQYKRKSGILLKKTTLPLIFLRNRELETKYIFKIPKDYIEKYGIVVFDKSPSGYYMVACENYESTITLKLLDFIRKENNVELELFTTSKEDIKFVLDNYETGVTFKSNKSFVTKEDTKKTASFGSDAKRVVEAVKGNIAKSRYESASKKENLITIDSVGQSYSDIKSSGKNFIKLAEAVISQGHLSQLPKRFVEKYRVVIFGETKAGELMLATDTLEDEGTSKAIAFIKEQYPLKIYTTSIVDFNLVLKKI